LFEHAINQRAVCGDEGDVEVLSQRARLAVQQGGQ
jgi:hypothetical protein